VYKNNSKTAKQNKPKMANKSQNKTFSVLAKPADFHNAFVASNFNNTGRLRRGLAINFKNPTNSDHGKNSLLKFQNAKSCQLENPHPHTHPHLITGDGKPLTTSPTLLFLLESPT